MADNIPTIGAKQDPTKLRRDPLAPSQLHVPAENVDPNTWTPNSPSPAKLEASVAPAPQTQAAPAINSQQINTGESNILDEIGGFLGNLFGGAFGQATQYPGYKWDSLNGWIPDQAAKAAPAPAQPKPAEPWHPPMSNAPAYSGPASNGGGISQEAYTTPPQPTPFKLPG